MRLFSGVIVVCLSWIVSLYGQIITVDDDGGADYTNVIEAVQAASDGDTILVAEGNYYGWIAITKSIVLLGAGPGKSTISSVDGNIFISAKGVKVSGFTLRVDVMTTYGTNISCSNSSPEITNNTFISTSDGYVTYDIWLGGRSAPEIHYNNFTGKGRKAITLVNDSLNINAENNWWGTTDESMIQLMIDDGNDQPGLGIVDYEPYLTEPTDVESDKTPSIMRSFCLYQNYPNPFNSSTTISYDLSRDSPIILGIYNVLGKRVRMLECGFKQKGSYKLSWDGRDDTGREVSSGVYLYRLITPSHAESKQLLLLK